MKHSLLSLLPSARLPFSLLVVLAAGLQLSQAQGAISASQARAQTAARPGFGISAAHTLPSGEMLFPAPSAIAPSAAISPSALAPAPSLRSLGASPVFSDVLVFADGAGPADSGGGEFKLPNVPDMTGAERLEIQQEIVRNVRRLGLQGSTEASPLRVALAWPVQGADRLNDYGYHGISAFVDHNAANPDHLRDYFCGTRTYDFTGYDHQGTDIFTWPFGWNKMDSSEVEVVAAAPGAIVFRRDGYFDRNCAMNGNPWNGVIIRHADGSQTWYLHMKKNSVTTKPVGATVASGEYLGVVGSSGSSTGPHLHFELHDAGGYVIDPYAGTCNNITSWWSAPRPYYDSGINTLTTGSAAPAFAGCPNPETSNAKSQFSRGETVYFSTYYRDQLAGQQSRYTVYQPDGAVYRSWTGASSASYYAASYWYRAYTLGASAPSGRWAFEVAFNGQTYRREFYVGFTVALRGQPADGAIRLDWEALGAVPSAAAWEITYEGPPGDLASPVSGLASSKRSLTLTGLTNYARYTVTVRSMVDAVPAVSDTVRLMPTDRLAYLPLILQ
jgi:murein DD-endopeptidase MepM/ murein hydrolase activator NlpD